MWTKSAFKLQLTLDSVCNKNLDLALSGANRVLLGRWLPTLLGFVYLSLVPSNLRAQAGTGNEQVSHPAPGTSIVRFGEIDRGVYKGSKPNNDADYRFLKSKNIKYIVDLKFFPLLYKLEERKARKYGMLVIPATMNASPISPSEAHVHEILCLLSDKRLRPIYFHCSVGRDRTSLIATLYEVYFKGLPPDAAWSEMKHFGFKDDWTLGGLRVYLHKHLTAPQLDGSATCNHIRSAVAVAE